MNHPEWKYFYLGNKCLTTAQLGSNSTCEQLEPGLFINELTSLSRNTKIFLTSQRSTYLLPNE